MKVRQLAVASCLLVVVTAGADDAFGPRGSIESRQDVCWRGNLFPSSPAGAGNISAVAARADTLLIGGDEGRAVQVLTKGTSGCYDAGPEIALPADGPADDEADIEGIARDGEVFYVVGSHSTRRKQVELGKSAAKNRERLLDVKTQASRRGLFRIKRLPDGAVEKASLTGLLAGDAVLNPFIPIPSKENGIDIEGLAADGEGRLFVGFRGPVLRLNFVPVAVLTLPASGSSLSAFTSELRYVNLDGQGIRDLVRVDGGFLILSGPVGDAPPQARLYFWDGKDGLPDGDRVARAVLVVDLPSPAGGKAEGLTLLEKDQAGAEAWDLLVVYDGVAGGAPTRFAVRKPR